MAISRLSTTTSPLNSSSKLKPKKMLSKKPIGNSSKSKRVQFDSTKNSIIHYEKKVEKASYTHSSVNHDSSAMKRASEFQEKLPSNFPSFIKPMLQSHVTRGFWLSFPKSFTNAHLPIKDSTVVLIGEDETEYKTKYLIDKNGLSGGWRGFALAHKLLEGDVIIFQLIEPCKFKVFIMRSNDLTEIDGAISLLNLDSEAKPIDQIETNLEICDAQGAEYIESPTSSNDDATEGLRFAESAIEFNEVKSFNRFNILIDDLIIDSKVPEHIKLKYYELCCSQKSFIHNHLLKGLNVQLAAGIISETVNIADGIRSAQLTTMNELKTWDKTLKAFEDLGMGVGFLRGRIGKLVEIAGEREKKMELKKVECAEMEEKVRGFEEKLLKVKKEMKKLKLEMEALKGEDERVEINFQVVAGAHW